MLTLNDGRNELWQWDTGRKLKVDADCSQVHFSNKIFGRSLDVDVVDGVASIPDILLQTEKDLIAWAFVGTAENGYTKISKVFKVNRRNKPADYVFTPSEQTTLAEIMERLDGLESIQDPDAIKNAVENYLEQNPVESPVQSVNGKIGKVELTAEDVGAISQDDLQEATNEALAQAKASGEFDGEDGITPHIGANGNWYLGETDTGIKAQGKDGVGIADIQKRTVAGREVLYIILSDGTEKGFSLPVPENGKDYVLTDADRQEIAELAAELVEVPEGSSGGGIDVSGATVGQTVKIAAVDGNGVPTAWEATDFPESSGGGGEKPWRLINTITITEDTTEIIFSEDMDGNPFELSEYQLLATDSPGTTSDANIYFRHNEDASYQMTRYAFIPTVANTTANVVSWLWAKRVADHWSGVMRYNKSATVDTVGSMYLNDSVRHLRIWGTTFQQGKFTLYGR